MSRLAVTRVGFFGNYLAQRLYARYPCRRVFELDGTALRPHDNCGKT